MSTSAPDQVPTTRRSRTWWYLGAAAVVPMVTSSVYYTVFASTWLRLRGVDPGTTVSPEALALVGQLARNAVVVGVLATLVRRLRIGDVGGAVRLGVLLWLGFEAMAILGSVLHEQYPLGLYLLHVGDALLAMLVMASLVGLANRERAS